MQPRTVSPEEKRWRLIGRILLGVAAVLVGAFFATQVWFYLAGSLLLFIFAGRIGLKVSRLSGKLPPTEAAPPKGFLGHLGTAFNWIALILLVAAVTTIFYNPIPPEGSWLFPLLFGFLGLLFGGIGLMFVGMDRSFGEMAAKQQRIERTGLDGFAYILQFADSNMTFNDDPVVDLTIEIRLPDRPPYAVKQQNSVPRLKVGLLTAGQPIPVKVDPQDPQQIHILW